MQKLPISVDPGGVPYLANSDSGGNLAVPTEQYIISGGLYVPVSATNPLPTSVVGSLPNQTLVEQKTQADAVGGVLTFSDNIGAIEIYNTDATNAGVFTVNGISINVPAGKVFSATAIGGTSAKTVTISGALTYIVSRYI